MDEKKSLDEELKDVSGGLPLALASLAEKVKENIPEDMLVSLKGLKSDNEILKALREKGINLEALEGKLSDESLTKIYGGYDDIFNDPVYCPNCGEGDPDNISIQIFTSIIDMRASYRCRKCGQYFIKNAYGKPSKL